MKPTLLLAILVTAIALGACGGDDDPGPAATATQVAPAPATSATPAPTATATTPATGTTAPPATRAPARLAVGIGEQGHEMFASARFRALGITKARRVVPYDAARLPVERDIMDAWLGEARRAGVEPFITFGFSREHPRKLPSVAEFRSAFRGFRARYPDVRVYAPWNEINHISQPTARAPRRAAEYYNVVRNECTGCTVLAGDVLDQAGMTRYLARYRRHLDGEPAIWGLHNYADTNRFRSSGLRALLGAVRGDVWLTETGGIVKFGRNFPRDEQRAGRAVRFALELARDNARVKRIYLYNWTAARPADRFDSGLVGLGGEPRPGYERLRAALGK